MANLLFKIQGGEHYGLGHLNRCLNIAKLFKEFSPNVSCFFIINRNEFIANKLTFEKFNFEYNDKDIVSTISNWGISKIIFDQFDEIQSDAFNLKSIYPEIFICALDYFNIKNKNLDLVINLINRSEFKIFFSKRTKYHEGFQYATLKSEFLTLRLNKPSTGFLNNRILITFGGSDPQQYTEFVLNLISNSNLDLSGYHLTVAITSIMNVEENLIGLLPKLNCGYSIVKDADNMAELISESIIGICSGGTTMYEFSILGVPAIVLPQNNNELLGALKFSKFNSVQVIESKKISSSQEIIEGIKLILNDKNYWNFASQSGKNAIDGLGALRIYKMLRG